VANVAFDGCLLYLLNLESPGGAIPACASLHQVLGIRLLKGTLYHPFKKSPQGFLISRITLVGGARGEGRGAT